MTAPALELRCPTPLCRLDPLSSASVEVWLKDDGLIHPLYGGNKVRKLGALLATARARGARRILTFGPAGSHHVLATALFARDAGLECAALLLPQPESPHAVETLRAGLGAGLSAFPARSLGGLRAFRSAFRSGDVLIPPGGANADGAAAYARALRELLDQFAERGLPPPDCVVLALGTGGTAAGLLAGVALNRVETEIHAVSVVRNPAARFTVTELAARVLSRHGQRPHRARLREKLHVEQRKLGPGYGHPTGEGGAALERAAELGVVLDATYTAKAFARVLEMVRTLQGTPRTRPLRIVYWHTLSAAPLAPLLAAAPAWEDVEPSLRRLLTPRG